MTDQEFCDAVRLAHSTMRKAVYSIVESEEIEDVVSHAVLRAWQHRGTFNGDAKIATWLVVIARNAALDLHRKRASRPKIDGEDDSLMLQELPDGGPSPEALVYQSEVRAVIHEKVSALPKQGRRAFHRWLSGETLRDSTLKTNAHRAKLRVIDETRAALAIAS